MNEPEDVFAWLRTSLEIRIRNRTIDEFRNRYGFQRIPLNDFILIMKGKDNQAANRYFVIRLLGCTSCVPLTGAHYLEVSELGPLGSFINDFRGWFKSLTFLKKQYCGLVDRLSIARCCYLLLEHDGHRELVRLKSILSIVDVPYLTCWDSEFAVYDPKNKNLKEIIKKQMKEFRQPKPGFTVISQRTENQLDMCLHQVYNGMRRSNRSLTEDEVIQKFQDHVQTVCAQICESIKPKAQEEVSMEMTKERDFMLDDSICDGYNPNAVIAQFPDDFFSNTGETCEEWC